MKSMKKTLTALIMAAVLCVSASAAVFADDTADAIEPAVITVDGMEQITVTSSDTSAAVDAVNFYDHSAETKCKITFAAEEEKIFSVYTATKVPEALSAFAAILEGESGTVLTLSVYGTNDSLLVDWTPLAIEETIDTIGDFAVFKIADEAVKYSFYRFDFVLELGDYFELSELALFAPVTDEPELEYAATDVIEPGETPELVPVAGEITEPADETVDEAEDSVAAPSFGLMSKFPMPMFKFLPRTAK